MREHTIIEIDNFLVSSAIFTEQFICDLSKCKGACCIIGDSGAPLEDSECKLLEMELGSISKYLSPEGKDTISNEGLFVKDRDGDIVTPLINGEECAYTYFDSDDNCLCSIEKCYFAKETSFRKPISCWLYPIRVSKLSNGMTALNLHQWHICLDAFAKGKKEGVPVFKFLKEPLTFAFGEEFYAKLELAYDQLYK